MRVKTIKMDSIDRERFDKMCSQIERLTLELCGGEISEGFVKEMKTNMAAHTTQDNDNFKKVFDKLTTLENYRTKTQLLVGWSWKAVGLMGTFIAVVCGLIQFLIEVIFK